MNNETMILGGLVALVLAGNGGDRVLQNLTKNATLNAAHSEIEAENTEAMKALAHERINSGLCLPTDRPIRPGMMAVIALPTGSCLIDSQGMTAITNQSNELTQLAKGAIDQ